MNDIAGNWSAMPVRQPEFEAHCAEVESFQRARLRTTRAINWGLGAVAVVAMIANVALGVSVAGMLPLVRLVPVFYWVHSDGTVDAAASINALPPTQSEAVIRSAVWQYVRDREGYSYANARRSYDLIHLMSTEHVNKVYQQWFLPGNPESPQVTVGKRGQINIEKLNIAFIRNHVAQVRYRRILEMYDADPPSPLTCKPPVCTTWTATVEFELIDRVPGAARDDNPGGLLVTRYQVAEGAQ